jgi:hypothetical protein
MLQSVTDSRAAATQRHLLKVFGQSADSLVRQDPWKDREPVFVNLLSGRVLSIWHLGY